MRWRWLACVALAMAGAADAATPREMLTTVAFETSDKRAALAGTNQALAAAEAMLAANPADRDGLLAKATAIGYRAKLTKSPSDAKTCRQLLEAFVAANPRDPEGQLSLGGWHLDTFDAGFPATLVLAPKKDLGIAAIDKAVALGGNRAFFKGFAAMMRVRLDPGDPIARQLAEQAAAGATLRAGDGKAAQALVRRLLPMGKLS